MNEKLTTITGSELYLAILNTSMTEDQRLWFCRGYLLSWLNSEVIDFHQWAELMKIFVDTNEWKNYYRVDG